MTFEERLRVVVAPAKQHDWDGKERATEIVAIHAPYLLRRFAEMAAAFDGPGQTSGHHVIFARRDNAGYTFVEFTAPGLHVVFEVVDGEPLLFWIAGGETDRRVITVETPPCAFDAMLLDAVSACINTRPAVVSANRVKGTEAQHV